MNQQRSLNKELMEEAIRNMELQVKLIIIPDEKAEFLRINGLAT